MQNGYDDWTRKKKKISNLDRVTLAKVPEFACIGEAHRKFVKFTKSFLVRPTLSTLSSDVRENGKGRREEAEEFYINIISRSSNIAAIYVYRKSFSLAFLFFFFVQMFLSLILILALYQHYTRRFAVCELQIFVEDPFMSEK